MRTTRILTVVGIVAMGAAWLTMAGCSACGPTAVAATPREPCVFDFVGPAGPDGAIGPMGDVGPTGSTGSAGAALVGLTGPAGSVGLDGDVGPM